MPRCEGRGFQSRSSWRRSTPQLRPPRGTCMCTQVAAPRTRAYAHAVLILGLDINPGIVFSLSSFLSFASFLSFLRFLFCPCRAPFFWLCITRPRHPPQTKSQKKKPPRKEWLIGRSGENIQFRFLQKPELGNASCSSFDVSISVT